MSGDSRTDLIDRAILATDDPNALRVLRAQRRALVSGEHADTRRKAQRARDLALESARLLEKISEQLDALIALLLARFGGPTS